MEEMIKQSMELTLWGHVVGALASKYDDPDEIASKAKQIVEKVIAVI